MLSAIKVFDKTNLGFGVAVSPVKSSTKALIRLFVSLT